MLDRFLGQSVDDIVARIRAGDRTMFAALFEAYWTPLFEWAVFHIRVQGDAEDVVARVIGRLWVTRETLQVRTTLESYLFGAVRMEVLRGRRDAQRRNTLTDRLGLEDVPVAMGTSPAGPEQTLLAAERAENLDAAIAALPDRYRAVIALRWQRHMDYEEIAQILGLSNGAVRVLVTRALASLRRRIFPEV